MKAFKCIYCRKESPKAIPTVSHIITEALGGKIVLKNAVCKTCNEKINKEAEMPVRDAFVTLRNRLAVRTKKGSVPASPAKLIHKGCTAKVRMTAKGEIAAKSIFFKDEKGKEFALFAPPKRTAEFIERYKKKHPDKKLTALKNGEIIGEEQINFGVCHSEAGLRLAAKIALEMLCYKRSTDYILDEDFDSVRNYVLTGKYPPKGNIASIITDRKVYSLLDNILVGNHFVIFTPTTDRAYIAIVGLFGLIYYKVILQKRYSLYALAQELITVNAQTNVVYEPPFQYQFMPVRAFSSTHYADPKEAMKQIGDLVVGKLNRDMAEHRKHTEEVVKAMK